MRGPSGEVLREAPPRDDSRLLSIEKYKQMKEQENGLKSRSDAYLDDRNQARGVQNNH